MSPGQNIKAGIVIGKTKTVNKSDYADSSPQIVTLEFHEIICPGPIQETDELVTGQAGFGGCRVSVVSAGVNSVPEHGYGREVVSDAGVVLNVVEPSCHVHILLLLLDGQLHYE